MSLTASFSGRNVLVTGGAKGIGFAIAKKFLSAGANVFILDVDETQLEAVQKSHPAIQTISANLMNWEETREKVKGIGTINHLVNNAGVGRPAEPLLQIKPESIDEIFGVNLKALVNVTQTVAEGMILAKVENGTIVNVSSISDSVCVPGLAMYGCSKAAVTTFTKCCALELGPHGIRVNCVRPAMVKTEEVGRLAGNRSEILDNANKINSRRVIDRMVEMDEVADAVLFLSSSSSSIITGTDILIDGGIFTR